MQTFYAQLFSRPAAHDPYLRRLARLTNVSLAQIAARALVGLHPTGCYAMRAAGLIEWP